MDNQNRSGKSHDPFCLLCGVAAIPCGLLFAPVDFAGKKLRNGARCVELWAVCPGLYTSWNNTAVDLIDIVLSVALKAFKLLPLLS